MRLFFYGDVMDYFKCCHCGKTLGENLFYKDKNKPNGHTSRCKLCCKLYMNKELRREYEKDYIKQHPQRRRKIVAKYYINNKEKYKITQDTYRQTEQFKINHRKHAVERRTRMAECFVEYVDYLQIYKEAKGVCFYCGKLINFEEAEFDHYMPISKGGLHKKDNIRCSCMLCNRSKGARIPLAKEG